MNILQTNQGEQNGCRQRLAGYLSCQQRLALAFARSEAFGISMIRIWTWACAGITALFSVACGMAFTHLFTNIDSAGPDQVPEPGFMTSIGYSIGKRLFEFAEDQPGLDYAVILNHPIQFAIGLLIVHLGVGSGVWFVGIAVFRLLGAHLYRRKNNIAEQDLTPNA